MTLESVTIPPHHGKGKNGKARRDRRLRQELFEKQNGLCFWCKEIMEMNHFRVTVYGRTKENPSFASFEHLLPKSHGGLSGRINIVLAHVACNNARHRRRWPHDPVYGKQGAKLPDELRKPIKRRRQGESEPRHRIKAKPIEHTRMVLRGGYLVEK
jgi:5-methylcytosine-specific restriction endonuclease McrA